MSHLVSIYIDTGTAVLYDIEDTVPNHFQEFSLVTQSVRVASKHTLLIYEETCISGVFDVCLIERVGLLQSVGTDVEQDGIVFQLCNTCVIRQPQIGISTNANSSISRHRTLFNRDESSFVVSFLRTVVPLVCCLQRGCTSAGKQVTGIIESPNASGFRHISSQFNLYHRHLNWVKVFCPDNDDTLAAILLSQRLGTEIVVFLSFGNLYVKWFNPVRQLKREGYVGIDVDGEVGLVNKTYIGGLYHEEFFHITIGIAQFLCHFGAERNIPEANGCYVYETFLTVFVGEEQHLVIANPVVIDWLAVLAEFLSVQVECGATILYYKENAVPHLCLEVTVVAQITATTQLVVLKEKACVAGIRDIALEQRLVATHIVEHYVIEDGKVLHYGISGVGLEPEVCILRYHNCTVLFRGSSCGFYTCFGRVVCHGGTAVITLVSCSDVGQ